MSRALSLSTAAAGLLRALLARGCCARECVLLSGVQTTDWRSLTMTGERHRFELRLTGKNAVSNAKLLTTGLEDAEFAIPGHLVADIGVKSSLAVANDGSVALTIEALTVEG